MNYDALAGMMQQLAGTGWSDLERMGTHLDQASRAEGAEMREHADREAAIVVAAIETDAGRAFLDLLLRKTVLRPPSQMEIAASTSDAYAILKAKREGQNQVVFMLLGMLQHHHGTQSTQGGDL